MVRKLIVALLALVLCMLAEAAYAQAAFLYSPNRTDMVYDARRGIIYIANGPQVRRYRISTKSFLPALTLGVNSKAMGIDISADGSTLAVADANSSPDKVWIYTVNLNTLVKTRWMFPKDYYEGGAYSVAFAADNAVLITSMFNGSGWVPLRRLKPDGTYRTLASVRQDTMLSASGDRKTIAFAESNISDGAWGLYDVPTGRVVRRDGANGTGAFNFEIATDRLGGQFAMPVAGMYVYDADYQLQGTINMPVLGVAYHPVESEIYFPVAGTTKVEAYSGVTLQHLRTVEIGETFDWGGAFNVGRMRLSADGSLLMVAVPNGLRYVRMYAPLSANNVQVTVPSGAPSAIQLNGSIGNKKLLTYEIRQKPQHGTAIVYGSRVSYRPTPGYVGTDRFMYVVKYGEAVVAAYADITVM